MNKRALIGLLAVLLFATVAVAGNKAMEKDKTKDSSMTGWVTDTNCGAKGAKAGHTECCKKCVKMGAKYALYNPADGKVYILDPQSKGEEFAGDHVKVSGTVEGETLKVSKMEKTGEEKGMEKTNQ